MLLSILVLQVCASVALSQDGNSFRKEIQERFFTSLDPNAEIAALIAPTKTLLGEIRDGIEPTLQEVDHRLSKIHLRNNSYEQEQAGLIRLTYLIRSKLRQVLIQKANLLVTQTGYNYRSYLKTGLYAAALKGDPIDHLLLSKARYRRKSPARLPFELPNPVTESLKSQLGRLLVFFDSPESVLDETIAELGGTKEISSSLDFRKYLDSFLHRKRNSLLHFEDIASLFPQVIISYEGKPSTRSQLFTSVVRMHYPLLSPERSMIIDGVPETPLGAVIHDIDHIRAVLQQEQLGPFESLSKREIEGLKKRLRFRSRLVNSYVKSSKHYRAEAEALIVAMGWEDPTIIGNLSNLTPFFSAFQGERDSELIPTTKDIFQIFDGRKLRGAVQAFRRHARFQMNDCRYTIGKLSEESF